MTALEQAEAARTKVLAERAVWRAEFVDTLRLAAPMALTQLGQISMMTTDLMLLGRLGDKVVAAAALAHTLLFVSFTLGMGFMQAVAPLAAQAFGARQPRMVRRALRVGLWASLILGVPLTLGQFWGEALLIAVGQAPEEAALAARYSAGLAWCLVPSYLFLVLRNFMSAVSRPEPALWITLAAIPANAVIAYALIYGIGGLPRLELLGAGIATTLVSIGMCVAAIWIAYTRRPFKKYRVLGRCWRPDWQLMRQLVAVGAPISAAFLLEFGVFAAAALVMGTISTTALAAHQIALQTAAVMFMVPFGVSLAATVRVGQAAGRKDPIGTRRAGFAAILLGAAFMLGMTIIVTLASSYIPLLFLGGTAVDAAPTVALASTLLVVGASFFIADGTQTVAAGALRGLNDTRVPLLFAAFSFWGVAFSTGLWLAFRADLGAVGVWLGLSTGLVVYAALLVWRFQLLTRRGYLPAIPAV